MVSDYIDSKSNMSNAKSVKKTSKQFAHENKLEIEEILNLNELESMLVK